MGRNSQDDTVKVSVPALRIRHVVTLQPLLALRVKPGEQQHPWDLHSAREKPRRGSNHGPGRRRLGLGREFTQKIRCQRTVTHRARPLFCFYHLEPFFREMVSDLITGHPNILKLS